MLNLTENTKKHTDRLTKSAVVAAATHTIHHTATDPDTTTAVAVAARAAAVLTLSTATAAVVDLLTGRLVAVREIAVVATI